MRNIKYLSSVPPLVKYNYFGRIIFTLLLIPPNFAVFYQLNLDYHFYLLYFLHFSLYPHLAFFIAHLIKNPKKFELKVIMNAEHFFGGLWLPVVLFNPFIVFLGLVSSTSAAMLGGGSILLVCTKSISWICGGIVGGIIFGFAFRFDVSSSTILWTGISTLGGIFITNLLFVRANKLIVLTRKKLKEQKELLDRELEEAAAYVKKMLPLPVQEGNVQIDWRFIPSTSLGGDAFGYQWLDQDYFSIYLLDVSGHGVGAALLSASVLNVLRSESLPKTDLKKPEQVLKALNAAFPSDDNNDMFFTFWYGVYNSQNRFLTYASAGHPPALLLTNEKELIELKTDNFIIGGMPDVSYHQRVQTIDYGTSLFIYSDGVYEIEKKDGSMMSFSEYLSLVTNLNSDENNSLNNLFFQTLQISKGGAFEDDYTILKVDFK